MLFHIISIALVFSGAVIMAVAVRTSLKMNKALAPEFKGRWFTITRLMIFFLIGYCTFIGIELTGINHLLELITGIVFIGGALFVLLVIRLSRQTIHELTRNRTVISTVNKDLQKKTQDLEIEIKERIKTEEALRQSKTTLENIFNNSIPMCITNLDFKITMANEAYHEIFHETEIDGGNIFCFDSRPGSMCHTDNCPLKQIIAGTDQAVEECSKINESGHTKYFIVTARPFYNANNQLIGIVESFQNITLRKQAEIQLNMEKERLAITLQSIGDGVITTDLSGHIVLINRVARDLTGWSQNEAAGMPMEEVFHLVDYTTRKKLQNPVSKVLSSKQTVDITPGAVLIARDGWERFIADSAAPIFDRQSQLLGVVLVFRDISEKRKMESEIAKLDKLKAIGLLAGGIAHDFNNLLAAILGNISLARITAGLDPEVKKRLSKAEAAIIKAKGLTQQLLTFAKGGAPVKQLISLGILLRESTVFALRGSNTQYSFGIPPDLWSVNADSSQINQTINNLIINANQAMPEGGTITINAENCVLKESDAVPLTPGNYVKVTIEDQGSGIDREHLPMIFDPYFTTKQKGSGLGLATVYSIINRHGGFVDVDSEKGQGTRFTLYLQASTRITAPENLGQEPLYMGQGNILIMDDDESIRDVAGLMIKQLGYKASLATDGEEAVRMYQEAIQDGRSFDCVILDLTIPGGMGGKETVTKLRKIDPGLKAIVSSGYSSDPIMADFENYGFSSVICKPYDLNELSRVLHKLMPSEKSE